jgi:hypothetical protein
MRFESSFRGGRPARAVIGVARLDVEGTSPRSDEYSDIGSRSRRDRIWVQTMSCSVACLTRRCWEEGWFFDRLNLFYDPKSLAGEHQGLVDYSLPGVLVEQLTKMAGRPVSVGTIQAVPKPVGSDYDELTEGTELAHWVAKLPERFAGRDLGPNIEIVDSAVYFR